jgi:hypothetical protein
MVPLRRRWIIRSLTDPNIAVEPRNQDNAPTLYTDALSDHPLLKSTYSGQYCMFQTQASDEPLSQLPSVGPSGAEVEVLACLCMF